MVSFSRHLLQDSVCFGLAFVWRHSNFICYSFATFTIYSRPNVVREGPFLFLESAFGHMRK